MRAGAEFRFPGGESLQDQQDRVTAALEEIHRTGTLPALVVCHGGSIRVMLCRRDPRGLNAFHEFKVPERHRRPGMSRLPLVAFGALVVATVGAFFVTQHIKVKTPLFTGVHRYPATISPLHGGVCGTDRAPCRREFSFYLQHRSDDVSVYVIDQSGNLVRTLATGVHMRGGANPVRKYFLWNGRDDNGKVVPDGTYHYRIALIGQGRTIDETALPITVKDAVPHPIVTNVSPSVVAPGAPVTISYTDYHRSGTVQIYRTDLPDWWQRPPVKMIGTPWKHTAIVWDGKIRSAPGACRDVSGRVCDDRCGVQHRPLPDRSLPPPAGSTPHAGVTLRHLAAEPTLSPHRRGLARVRARRLACAAVHLDVVTRRRACAGRAR